MGEVEDKEKKTDKLKERSNLEEKIFKTVGKKV